MKCYNINRFSPSILTATIMKNRCNIKTQTTQYMQNNSSETLPVFENVLLMAFLCYKNKASSYISITEHIWMVAEGISGSHNSLCAQSSPQLCLFTAESPTVQLKWFVISVTCFFPLTWSYLAELITTRLVQLQSSALLKMRRLFRRKLYCTELRLLTCPQAKLSQPEQHFKCTVLARCSASNLITKWQNTAPKNSHATFTQLCNVYTKDMLRSIQAVVLSGTSSN